jgi:integrase
MQTPPLKFPSRPIRPLHELHAERGRLAGAVVATNTVLGYGFDWRAFGRWCGKLGASDLPASPETVSLYATDMLMRELKVVTVRRHLSAIAFKHRQAGLPVPVTSAILAVLSGAKRLRAEWPRQVLPLSVAEIRQISEVLYGVGTPKALRDRAILVIGIASALRAINLATMDLADIERSGENYVVQVRREKWDRQSRGRLIGLPAGAHFHTCPVRCLDAWLAVRRPFGPGPLFTRLDNRAKTFELQPERICILVKDAVARIGLDPTLYGSHSLRSGLVTAAGEAGAGELVIMAQTGHRSSQVLQRYFRRTNLFKANAAAMIGL